LVVSTTIVSPSQRQRESPRQARTAEASFGRPSSGTMRATGIISGMTTNCCAAWTICRFEL
jgi:hypothetical protein